VMNRVFRIGPDAKHLTRANVTDGPLLARVVILLGALSAFAHLSIDMYLPGLPSMTRNLHASPGVAQLSITACLIGLGAGQLIFGPISDRFGRLRPLIGGVFCYSAVSFACVFAPSIGVLIGLRFVQGSAGAAALVVSRAVVRDLRSGAAAARLFALMMIVNGAAPLIAPIIGAELLHLGTWRVVFVALGILGAILVLTTALILPETLAGGNRHKGGLKSELAVFRRLVSNPTFVGLCLASGFIYGALFCFISGTPFVVEVVYRVSPSGFSGIFALVEAGIIVCGLITRHFVERVGSARLATIGFIGAACGGIALFVIARLNGSFFLIVIGLFLVVSSVGVVNPTVSALALGDHAVDAGSASGLLGVAQFVMGGLAAPLVGVAGVHSALPMATVIAIMSVAALATFLAFGRRSPDRVENILIGDQSMPHNQTPAT
jgi:DHA1 family bicyclomycin/chloramphenicol resistance-like MFS transporter